MGRALSNKRYSMVRRACGPHGTGSVGMYCTGTTLLRRATSVSLPESLLLR